MDWVNTRACDQRRKGCGVCESCGGAGECGVARADGSAAARCCGQRVSRCAPHAYHDAVRHVAVRFGGYVARIVGDGVDIYFGYPMAGEDDAVRAVHAGIALLEEVRHLHTGLALDAPLQVRVGIATGLVAIGAGEAVAIAGTTPNLAARIQAVAAPGQVAVSPATRRIAGTQFVYDDLGQRELKGFVEPVRVSTVTAALSFDSRSAWRGRDGALPMIGREAELADLTSCWKLAAQGSCVGALIIAEPGFGKSRLTTALDQGLADEAHTTVRLQCSPFHVNSALQPFVQHLARAAGFGRNDSSLIQLEKLEAQLAIGGIEADRDVSLIAALLGIDTGGRYAPVALPPPVQLQQTKEALIHYFAGLAAKRPAVPTRQALSQYFAGISDGSPLLLLFEDMHWIDPTSLEVVDLLLSNSETARIALVMTARPEFKASFPPGIEVKVMHLARLDEAAARAIARNLATEIALPEEAIDRIIKKTDGVPLYIEEMTRMLLDAQGGRRSADGGLGVEIPDTLLDLLMERLDRLGPGKWLAQVGAVIGHEFPRGLLFAVADIGRDAFDQAVDVLSASGLILPCDSTGLRFVFKHALVEDTAYQSIPQKGRAALHGKAADMLLRDFAETVAYQPELAARHLSRANRPLEAAGYWLRAGQQALGRGAPREAAAHLRDGVAILAGAPESPERSHAELALLSVLGPTTMVMMGPGSATFGDVQKRAFKLCHELPGTPRRFPITYGLCLYHWGRAELAVARKLADDLLDAANTTSGQAEPVMAANNMNGMIHFHLGDAKKAREHLERSVSRYDAARDAALYPVYLMDFGVFGRFYLALATFVTGDADAARQHALDAHELAGRLNQPHTLGFSLLANFNIAAFRDEPEMASRFANQCVEFASAQGFPEFVAMARVVRGWAAARAGQLAAGLEDIEAGAGQWQATGFENWQSWFACLKAEALGLSGRHEQALSEIKRQFQRIDENGENQFRSLLMTEQACLLAAMPGTATEAARLFEDARHLAQAQGAPGWLRRIDSRWRASVVTAASRCGPEA